MKILHPLVIPVCLLIIGCTEAKESKTLDIEAIKGTIEQTLDKWHIDAAKGNHKAYIEAMSKNGTYIGTDASENWSTTAFETWSKPYFDSGKSWAFTSLERHVYLGENGTVAWFDELLDTKMGVCRGSGILQKQDEDWEINHYVLSLTVPNENLSEVIKVNHLKDSIIIRSFSKE